MEENANSSYLESFAKSTRMHSGSMLTQNCRVCLCETKDNDPKLDATLLMFKKPESIRTMIQESTGLQLLDLNNLPNRICQNCLKSLRAWYKFRSQAKCSDEYLKSNKLDSNLLTNTDHDIQTKADEVNEASTKNVSQIKGFEITVIKPEVKELQCNQIVLDKHTKKHTSKTNKKRKSFKCEYCYKSFSFDHGLSNHMKIYHSSYKNQTFQCNRCERIYRNARNLRLHQSRPCVPKKLIEECKVRSKNMPVEDIIAAGEKAIRETKISCILCKKNFETHDDFVTHYPNHQFNLHCTICQKDLKKVKLLERHMRMHLREKAYTCPICPRSFYARDDMRMHIQNHIKKEWVYRCNVCQKDYFKNREFEKHMIKHLEVTEDGNKDLENNKNDDEMENDEEEVGSDSNYSDEDDEMTMKIELESPKAQETFQLVKEEVPSDDECISPITGEKEHNSIKMEMDLPPSSDTVKTEVDMESTYPIESNNSIDLDEEEDATVKSEICEPELNIKLENPETDLSDEEEFIDEADEPDEPNEPDEPDEPDGPDDASTTFSISKYEITDDEREKYYQNLLDLVKVKCHVPDCQKECSSFKNAMLHFTNDHLANKEPPFVCVLCCQEFRNKKLIKQHSKKYYSFKCPVCLKLHKSFSNMNRHVQSSHLNDRFKCLFCDKRFGIPGKLRIHLNSHSSKKLFACYICHKEFYSSNGLYLHSKSHMVIKELQCGNCGRQIPSKSRLMKHIANCVQRRKGGLN